MKSVFILSFAFLPSLEYLLAVLKGKTIAVMGYGIQGKVQAATLRDSGCTVIVGTRPPRKAARESRQRRAAYRPAASPRRHARPISCSSSCPIPRGRGIYKSEIAPDLRPGQTLCFWLTGSTCSTEPFGPPADVNAVFFVPNASGGLCPRKVPEGGGCLRLRRRGP